MISGLDVNRIKVFISYSRRDHVAADSLVEMLTTSGFDVAIDRRDLPFGEKWQEELAEMIRLSDSVIWLISEASILSKWVNWELDEVAKWSKRLVPVMIAETRRDSLPRQIGEVHILPAVGVFDLQQDSRALVRALRNDIQWIKASSRLADRAHEWASGNRRPERLLRGSALKEAESWRMRRPGSAPGPSAEVLELILASRQASSRRWTVGSLIGASVAIVTLGLGAAAYYQGSVARLNEVSAITQRSNVLNRERRHRLAFQTSLEALHLAGEQSAPAALREINAAIRAMQVRPGSGDLSVPPAETYVCLNTPEPAVAAALSEGLNVAFPARGKQTLVKWPVAGTFKLTAFGEQLVAYHLTHAAGQPLSETGVTPANDVTVSINEDENIVSVDTPVARHRNPAEASKFVLTTVAAKTGDVINLSSDSTETSLLSVGVQAMGAEPQWGEPRYYAFSAARQALAVFFRGTVDEMMASYREERNDPEHPVRFDISNEFESQGGAQLIIYIGGNADRKYSKFDLQFPEPTAIVFSPNGRFLLG